MKPSEAIGCTVISRRMGEAVIRRHQGGRLFLCQVVNHPHLYFVGSWNNTFKLKRS